MFPGVPGVCAFLFFCYVHRELYATFKPHSQISRLGKHLHVYTCITFAMIFNANFYDI